MTSLRFVSVSFTLYHQLIHNSNKIQDMYLFPGLLHFLKYQWPSHFLSQIKRSEFKHLNTIYQSLLHVYLMSYLPFLEWFPGWDDKNTTSQQSSATSQPSDDGFANEDCVEMKRLFAYPGNGTRLTESFFWNDRNCEEKNPFICQHEKRRCT